MRNDVLKQFVALRAELEREKARLQARLAEIDRALAGEIPRLHRAERAAPNGSAVKRIDNPISLRAGVIKLTKGKPLTKEEIFAGLEKLGWKTTSKRPGKLLDVLLYGKNPKFKNQGGKFSPA